MTNWKPAIIVSETRPKFDKESFLTEFCIKYYGSADNGIYESLEEYFDLYVDEDNLACGLIRWNDWEYSQVKELLDNFHIFYEAEGFYKKQLKEWVERNNIKNPFKPNQVVKTKDGIGKILPKSFETYWRNDETATISVRLPEHEEETRRMRANGGTGTVLGRTYNWEDIEVLK